MPATVEALRDSSSLRVRQSDQHANAVVRGACVCADGDLIKQLSALQNGLLLSSHRRSFTAVTVEQRLRDGTRRAGSDFPIVDLDDRHDLARRAGEERFI